MSLNAHVITIMDNPQSIKAAKRCIESGKRRGIDVKTFEAITPRNTRVIEKCNELGIPIHHFTEKYSRHQPVIAAFLSHYHLWKHAFENKEDTLILEHDAFFVDSIDEREILGPIVNLGKPSYGNYKTPTWLGEFPLFSKEYLPGAHAYKITPHGAECLLYRAQYDAGPTDVYIHKDRFPKMITEYWPWPIEARDEFTTIQNELGCQSKHNYDENYKII